MSNEPKICHVESCGSLTLLSCDKCATPFCIKHSGVLVGHQLCPECNTKEQMKKNLAEHNALVDDGSLVINLGKIEWGLLRKQKEALLFAVGYIQKAAPNRADALNGVLHILDRIQDEAAKQVGEEAVFGKAEEAST